MIEATMTREPASTPASPNSTAASEIARRAMIDSQLRTSGVNEEFALSRMMAVPREDFLPADKAALAYIDRSVSLGNDAHLAAPLFYGKLLVEAAPGPQDRVLVVEGGTGYLASLLRPLVAELSSISAADAAAGMIAEGGPFSLILIDGAVEQLPDALAALLAEDGRVVAGLLLRQVTRLAAGRKIDGRVALLPIEELGIPVLHAFDIPKSWSFA
jgi:protein-L-isoaspartate(D-aspartate) O-methyltransferase